MTEDEARKKWCPMVSLDNVTPKLHGKHDAEPGRTAIYNPCCIASACMMWRITNKKVDHIDVEAGWEEVYGVDCYCGLGGKP